jgi:hypothetical protein
MPDRVKSLKSKRLPRAGAEDTYNPVNMAGKATESCEEPPPKEVPVTDNYNPVNMAGKKAEAIEVGEVAKPAD